MKTSLGLIALGFFIVFFQVSLVDLFQLGDHKPDLRALFVFLVALRLGPVFGVWTGFFVGLSLDVFTGYMGTQALIGSVLGFLFGLVEERVIYFKRQSYIFLYFWFCWFVSTTFTQE